LLLVPAGAAVNQGTRAGACSSTFEVVFVTDAELLRSSINDDGWRGVSVALRDQPCGHARLIISPRPSEYRRNLQLAADYQPGLVIAASFLLRDAVLEAAAANPRVQFVLVDPMVSTPGSSNLAVLSFREDQTAYLAGALAALVTKSGVVAGVYGPEGEPDKALRHAFERGAALIRQDVSVLGAYQPAAEPSPYTNPAWGSGQARAFIAQGADVIFGIGGSTGQGALRAAAEAGKGCIGAEPADASVSSCLLATASTAIELAVAAAVREAAAGRWSGGTHSLGLAEGMVRLTTRPSVPAEVVQRLAAIQQQLVSRTLSTGV
jgi:basic membrane protein A and related proteins